MKHRLTPWKIIALAFSGLLLLFIGATALSFLLPGPAIRISSQTTYFTEPLRDDGTVNYLAALDALAPADMTDETNAARDYAQAWRHAYQDETLLPAALMADLGVNLNDGAPRRWLNLENFTWERPELYLKTRALHPAPPEEVDSRGLHAPDELNENEPDVDSEESDAGVADDEDISFGEGGLFSGEGGFPAANGASSEPQLPDDFSDAIWEWHSLAVSRPWTAEQYPLLAAWLESNAEVLAHVHVGARKPHFHLPFYYGGSTTLLETERPIQTARAVMRAMAPRVMLYAGQGELDLAVQEANALLRMGRHISQTPAVIDQLVGIAIERTAIHAIAGLAHEAPLSADQLAELTAAFDAAPPRGRMVDALNYDQRALALDTIQWIGTQSGSGKLQLRPGPEETLPVLTHGVDWNVALEMTNEYFDRLVQVARAADKDQQHATVDRFEAEFWNKMRESSGLPVFVRGLVDRGARSELTAQAALALLAPAAASALNAELRANVYVDLGRTSLALALCRAAHGDYPADLSALVPEFLPAVPLDRYSGKPLLYRCEEQGYLLYSVGPNQRDDQGWGYPDQGKVLNEEEDDWVRNDVDDFRLRVPLEPE